MTILTQRNRARVIDRAGVSYRILTHRWQLSDDLEINYMLVAEKAA